MRYIMSCDSVRIIQLNTDGIMISLEKDELWKIYHINKEWQSEKSLELEEDKISAVYQKDVNNYIVVFENGKVKTKGAYVTYGEAGAGAYSINNNHTIVKEAVINYFVHKTPVEQTIYDCNDIHKFQIIAKAGGGYKACYSVPGDFEERKKRWQKENRFKNAVGKTVTPNFRWENYEGPRQEIQRVNRVYASVDPDRGYVVKVKPDGTVGKIGGLPDSCIIDNKNELDISAVDKSWYVELAKKYVADYLGV